MNKNTILWADDDLDDLEICREVLFDLTTEFEMIEFTNGKDILDYLQGLDQNNHPSLIVLDLNMPVITGREALAILKNDPNYQSIPVVVFSTSNSETDKSFCSRYSTEMITKPPSYDGLREVIRKLLNFCRN
jgi:CheY-like chemotaxis protein